MPGTGEKTFAEHVNNKIINCPNCSVLQFWDGAEE